MRCRLVLLMVFDHAAAEDLLKANRDRLGGRYIAMLTDVAPRESAALAALVAQAGGNYVEAQIYATADEVAAHRAWGLVAGSDTGPTDRVASLLEGIGRVRRLGAPPAASAMKIAVLNLFLALLPAIGASAALVQRRGLPDEAFIDILSDDSAFPPFVGDLVRRMTRRDFAQPINDLRGITKDLAVLVTELSDSGLPLAATLSAPLGDLLQRAIAAGRGGDDICTLIDLFQAKRAG